jgi:hypothetical protein
MFVVVSPAVNRGGNNVNSSYRVRRMWLLLSRKFQTTYTARKCGHETQKTGIHVLSNGVEAVFKVPVDDGGIPEYCPSCIEQMATICPNCGASIHIGEWILTGTDVAENGTESTHILTCRSCQEFPIDLDGIWEVPGRAVPNVWPWACKEGGVAYYTPSSHHNASS